MQNKQFNTGNTSATHPKQAQFDFNKPLRTRKPYAKRLISAKVDGTLIHCNAASLNGATVRNSKKNRFDCIFKN